MSAPRAVATGTTINLYWNSVAAARNYLLQYRDGSGAWQSSSDSYYGTSTSWTNVPNIVNRTYRMRACISGCGEWSSASNSITTSPTAPSITMPTTDTDGSYSLSWSSISSASRYEVQGESKGTIYSGSSRSLTRTNPSGSYSYKVRACNIEGCSAYSSTKTIAVKIKPGVPSLTLASTDADGTYTVSWGSVSLATSYELDGEQKGIIYSGSSRSKARTNPSGSYSYKVRACNSYGCSAYSGSKTIAVKIKPGVPALTVASTDADGTYTVSWGSVSLATSYELDGEQKGIIYSGSSRSKTRTNPSGSYSYKVRACNSYGCSAYSGSKTIAVKIKPGVPALTVASTDLDGTYSVSWSSVSLATSYELDGEQKGIIYSGSSRSKTRTNPSGNYSYKVRACNSYGCSAYSGSKTITVEIKPGVPSLTLASTDLDGTYSVSWGSVSVATSYELDGEQKGIIYSGSSRSLTRTNPSGGYSYKVRACNSFGCSAYSSTKTIAVNIKPGVPSLTLASSDADGTYSVSWGSVSFATSYELDGEQKGIIYSGSSRSVSRTNEDGSYSYKVRACNSLGCSAYSPIKTILVQIVPSAPAKPITKLGDGVGKYDVLWSSVTSATYYELHSIEQGMIYSGALLNYSITVSAGNHDYKVRACNNYGCSGYSAVATLTASNTFVRYQHTDMLGTPIMETDANGGVISRSVYEPFGKRLGGEKEGIGYTGHLQDTDLGLTYMQARYYDPLIGRFYSNDPIGALGHDNTVHGFNRYAYANNNPYKYIDPDGEAGQLVVANGAGIGGTMMCGPVCGGIAWLGGLAVTTWALNEAVDALSDGEGATDEEIFNSDNPDDGTAGKPLTQKEREEFWKKYKSENDDYECWRCGYKSDDKDEFEVGHRNKPRSEGGTKHEDNLRCEGTTCNRSAGNRGKPKTTCQDKKGCS
ncbi:RHS repeat-associated core domain-containing protein [Shewanella benthica]|nr:RHS repeat-associated core domain-containing protein [Shewanella benthica]